MVFKADKSRLHYDLSLIQWRSKVILNPAHFLNILGEYFPDETREFLAKGDGAESIGRILAGDPVMYRIFVYAAETPKADRESLANKFGSDGIDYLDRPIEIGAISERDTGFFDNLAGIIFPSEDVVKQISIHHFAMISLDTPGTAIENFRGALSAEGVALWYKAKDQYRAQLHRILDEKKGEIVVVASLIQGPTESEEIEK